MNKTWLLLLILGLTGCYYDNAETLYPDQGGTCDVTNVTYNVTVKQILTSNCLMCHSTSAANASGGGIKLENYTDLKVYVTNQKLYGSITQSSGYSPMPKGGNKLGPCAIQQIKKWIDDGAAQN